MSDGTRSSDELKELGNQAFASKNYDEAIQHYSAAVKVDPGNHILFSNRSASHGGLKKWQLAADDAKECVRLDPSFIKGYYRLATAQIELEEYDAALATIRQGLALDANNSQFMKQMRTVTKIKKQRDLKKSSVAGAPRSSGITLDDATSRELQDLQGQLVETTREYNTIQANLNQTTREYKINEITKSDLEKLPQDANCFRGVGKMFLKSTQSEAIDYLEKEMENQRKLEKDMTQQVQYLDKRTKSLRSNMEEIIGRAS